MTNELDTASWNWSAAVNQQFDALFWVASRINKTSCDDDWGDGGDDDDESH